MEELQLLSFGTLISYAFFVLSFWLFQKAIVTTNNDGFLFQS